MFIKINELARAMYDNYWTNDFHKAYLAPNSGTIINDNEDKQKLPDAEREDWISLPAAPFHDIAYDYLDICLNAKEKIRFIESFKTIKEPSEIVIYFDNRMYKSGFLLSWYNYLSDRLIEYAKSWCYENNYKFTDKYYFKKNGGLFSDY